MTGRYLTPTLYYTVSKGRKLMTLEHCGLASRTHFHKSYTHVVVAVRREYKWLMLGIGGYRDNKPMLCHRMVGSVEEAKALAEKWTAEVWDEQQVRYNSEHGDNTHLLGVRVFRDVVIYPIRERGRIE